MAVMELIAAAREGNVPEVKRLVAQGADVDVQDAIGWRPVHYAAFTGTWRWWPRWCSSERT